MKKTVIRMFALLLVAAMVLSLGLTAAAAEINRGDIADYISGGLREDIGESLTGAAVVEAAANTRDGIFALEVQTSDRHFYTTAFLMEKQGNVYLVTDTLFTQELSGGTLTLHSRTDYAQKATYLGEDGFFVYLQASGLDGFMPLSAGDKVYNNGRMFMDMGANGLGYVDLALNQMGYLPMEGGDYAFFNPDREPDSLEIGAPIIDGNSLTVFAIGSAGTHPETGAYSLIYFTFTGLKPAESYALDIGSGGGAAQPTQPAQPEEPAEEPEDPSEEPTQPKKDPEKRDDDGGSRKDRDEEPEEEKSFEFKPIYLAIIGVLVVAAFLIIRTNTRGGHAGPKPGTVAVEPEPQPVEAAVWEAPQNPEPDFFPVQDMVLWQLRGVSGSFSGKTFPLSDSLRMGRSSQCQVLFPNGTPGISSNHCEITLENGAVVLRDLGSSYGTFVRGGKLAPNAPCVLNPGETFTLAQEESFLVEQLGAPQQTGGITVRDSQGREYRTGSQRMAFGRGQDNKVTFAAEEKGISSRHCVLYKENGKLYLMDLGSTNGTFFTEENRLKPNTPYRVRKGMAFFLVNRKNTFVVVEE